MSSPRKEGKAPYPSHRYPSWAFDPHSNPYWLIGTEQTDETRRQKEAVRAERELRKAMKLQPQTP